MADIEEMSDGEYEELTANITPDVIKIAEFLEYYRYDNSQGTCDDIISDMDKFYEAEFPTSEHKKWKKLIKKTLANEQKIEQIKKWVIQTRCFREEIDVDVTLGEVEELMDVIRSRTEIEKILFYKHFPYLPMWNVKEAVDNALKSQCINEIKNFKENDSNAYKETKKMAKLCVKFHEFDENRSDLMLEDFIERTTYIHISNQAKKHILTKLLHKVEELRSADPEPQYDLDTDIIEEAVAERGDDDTESIVKELFFEFDGEYPTGTIRDAVSRCVVVSISSESEYEGMEMDDDDQ